MRSSVPLKIYSPADEVGTSRPDTLSIMPESYVMNSNKCFPVYNPR